MISEEYLMHLILFFISLINLVLSYDLIIIYKYTREKEIDWVGYGRVLYGFCIVMLLIIGLLCLDILNTNIFQKIIILSLPFLIGIILGSTIKINTIKDIKTDIKSIVVEGFYGGSIPFFKIQFYDKGIHYYTRKILIFLSYILCLIIIILMAISEISKFIQ